MLMLEQERQNAAHPKLSKFSIGARQFNILRLNESRKFEVNLEYLIRTLEEKSDQRIEDTMVTPNTLQRALEGSESDLIEALEHGMPDLDDGKDLVTGRKIDFMIGDTKITGALFFIGGFGQLCVINDTPKINPTFRDF